MSRKTILKRVERLEEIQRQKKVFSLALAETFPLDPERDAKMAIRQAQALLGEPQSDPATLNLDFHQLFAETKRYAQELGRISGQHATAAKCSEWRKVFNKLLNWDSILAMASPDEPPRRDTQAPVTNEAVRVEEAPERPTPRKPRFDYAQILSPVTTKATPPEVPQESFPHAAKDPETKRAVLVEETSSQE